MSSTLDDKFIFVEVFTMNNILQFETVSASELAVISGGKGIHLSDARMKQLTGFTWTNGKMTPTSSEVQMALASAWAHSL